MTRGRARGVAVPRRVLNRSEVMSRVRGKDTGPEMRVRRCLHAAGLRYRTNVRSLRGAPDVVLSSRRIVIFVHGCFWHRHPGCAQTRTPKSRVRFWEDKFAENVRRDRESLERLREQGWTTLVIWECEIQRDDALKDLVNTVRAAPRHPRARRSQVSSNQEGPR